MNQQHILKSPELQIALCKNHHWAMDRQLIAPGPDGLWHIARSIIRHRSTGEAELADLDGNGNLDMAVGHGNSAASNLVSVLLNNGSGAFSLPSAYSVGNAPLSVFAADLDADGDLDLIVANAGDNTISFLSNHGNGTFSYDSDYPVGDFPIALFEADLDGNGSIDLATANRNSGNLSVLLSFIRGDANDDGIINIGDMVYLLNYLYKKGPPPSPLSSADANCDGVVDIGDAISLINYLFKSGLLPSC